jgi:membrane protease YdiL (CAAX protease family)
VHPFLNALLTGLIWAAWHVPYFLYFLNRETFLERTSLSVPGFIWLSFLIFPLISLAFGELRLLSKSVWPGWLMHILANSISLVLISGSFITLSRDFAGVFFSPGTEGVFISILMALIGLELYQIRKRLVQ